MAQPDIHPDDLEWEATAIHEAGHAVALVVFDLLLHDVVAGEGHGVTAGDELPDDIEDANHAMVTALAGGTAELRLYDEVGVPTREAERRARAGAQTDMANAASLLPHASIDLDEAEDMAIQFVDDWWDAIEEVAAALLDNDGYLSGAAVEDIVDEMDGGEDDD